MNCVPVMNKSISNSITLLSMSVCELCKYSMFYYICLRFFTYKLSKTIEDASESNVFYVLTTCDAHI